MLIAHLPSILNGSIAPPLMRYYHEEAGTNGKHFKRLIKKINGYHELFAVP